MSKSVSIKSNGQKGKGERSEKSQTSGTRKSGGQRDKDGRAYETAVEHVLKHFISKDHSLQVETLSNVTIENTHFDQLLDELKDNLDCSLWKSFVDDASKDFLKLEIDLIIKISVKPDERSVGETKTPKTLFLPYDMKDDEIDEEIGYELSLDNGPILIYLEITNNPHEFHKKLWQVERVITLHKILESKRLKKEEIFKPEIEIETELKGKIEMWKAWLEEGCSTYYSVVSNKDRNVWTERFVSKLCIFHEQPTFSSDIIFEPELEKDLLKLLVKNDIKGMVTKYKEKRFIKENSLQHTNTGEMLKNGRMLFIFADASLNVILDQISTMEKDYKERMANMEKTYLDRIGGLEDMMKKMYATIEELKEQKNKSGR